jgi:hypothetical protein
MKISEAKRLFKASDLKEPKIVPAFMGSGYNLQLLVNRDVWSSETLVARSGKTREFKKVEAVITVLSEIGFKEAIVTFD